MVRFILRVAVVLGGILLVAAVAAGIAVTWARAGVDVVSRLAPARLAVRAVLTRDGRWFAELERL